MNLKIYSYLAQNFERPLLKKDHINLMLKSFLNSLYYYPLKLIVTITNLLYFKKIRVHGLKNIPKDGAVIYAITHQNSLLDAYLSNGFSWRSPYYLVRADIYKNKIIDKMMRGIRTLPVYRIRDGFDSIKKNDQIFDRTKDILSCGGVVALFPEGSHSMTHQVRPLKKGIARMAFMAETAEDFNLNLKIVPIGIYYESYLDSNSRTLVSYGKPFGITEYKERFLQDQNEAYRSMLSELSKRMKSLVVQIESANYDRVYEKFQEKRVFKKRMLEQLESDQKLVHCIENDLPFEDTSDNVPLLHQMFDKAFSAIRRVVGYIPKFIVQKLAKKVVKDKNFLATVKYSFSLVIYPLFFLFAYFLIKIALNI